MYYQYDFNIQRQMFNNQYEVDRIYNSFVGIYNSKIIQFILIFWKKIIYGSFSWCYGILNMMWLLKIFEVNCKIILKGTECVICFICLHEWENYLTAFRYMEKTIDAHYKEDMTLETKTNK